MMRRAVLRLSRAFGDLRVRPKLMVLHNLFFLVLAGAAYFSLIPLFQKQVSDARKQELELVRQVFSADLPVAQLKGLETYQFRSGTASDLQVPRKVRAWLDSNPGEIWWERKNPFTYRRDPQSGVYYRLRTDLGSYNEIVARARLTLFFVLGAIYVLAVLLLESAIMPLYVYRPLRLLLEADRATQQGDRDREMISDRDIPGDEIGQIMRSRNATVSQLRRHEDDLEAALRRLEEQDRLASLGLLSASVAHELNTPLSVLHGSIEKLRETTTDPHALERLMRMERVTQRLRKISEGLVDFARARKQRMEAICVRPLVDEAWQLVAIDERSTDVQFTNRAEAALRVFGNADRLVQVFVNLLRNALDAVTSSHSRGGCDIRVCSRAFVWNDQPWVSVTVEDNGPGIPADVLPEMFEAFVTTRLDARGTGLGLTVTEGIVTQHGGTINAFNRPDGGATLEVRLPAHVRTPKLKTADDPAPGQPAPGALVDITLLDDDGDFRTYLEDFLRDEGLYSVRAFAHPEDLFLAAAQRLPDIVLLDMKMGEFRGDQVLEQLLARWPGLCVIIVTGYPSLEDMRATFKLKVFDYIAKPFSLGQLRQTLKNAVEHYGLGRTPQDRLRERLGHRIKMLRVERGWSLKDLAAATKLSVSQISSIERGANLPSIESFLAICRAFDRRPSEMLASIDF